MELLSLWRVFVVSMLLSLLLFGSNAGVPPRERTSSSKYANGAGWFRREGAVGVGPLLTGAPV
ncbi:hypothetical protein LVJ94_39710 [Pendulispora rubella]|uniref:Uncharacterized protein n=1 Tax=Pendulispora rubella TaxID=2741070 RepID=A0ABZ2KWG8_9BACT